MQKKHKFLEKTNKIKASVTKAAEAETKQIK